MAESTTTATEMRWFGALQLDGATLPEWIPIHRVCDRVHPTFGRIVMTEEKMQKAIANFKGRVHRPESPVEAQVPIDTRHSGDAACAWLADMRINSPFLEGKPVWNKRGEKVIRDREFMYISPAYDDDPERGPIFKEVTLTNRDFLKMPPITTPIVLDEGVWPELSPIVFPTAPTFGFALESPSAIKAEKEALMADQKPTAPATGEATIPAAASGDGSVLNKQITLSQEEFERLQKNEKTLAELGSFAKSLESKIAAQEKKLAEKEETAKQTEVASVIKDALARGVDAFTAETVKRVLLSLPREQDGYEIKLEDAAPAHKSVYAAVKFFLEKVPGVVPQGEVTHAELSNPTQPATASFTKTDVDAFLKAAGVQLEDEPKKEGG